MDWTTRRRVLATGAVALAASVAGCATGDDDGDGDGGDGGGDGGGGGGDGDGGGDQTTGTAQTETDVDPDTTTETATTGDGGPTSVVVGPNGSFRFAPSSVTVATGDTVEWVWSSGGHNVVPESTPDGSDFGGSEGDESTTYDAGHSFSYTFETPGTYAYYCAPHRSSGMTGEVVVE